MEPTNDERPFSEVLINYLSASVEYANHPDTPKDAAAVVRKLLRRIKQEFDDDEYEFPDELDV
ncbi:MAG TPA: hypothetical protein VE715_21035 [Blastocatellia bacterium]|nr:hypothetical protein [Blastocatellia bacterium]